jgi:DNA-binding NarL/FixJ family response regulator
VSRLRTAVTTDEYSEAEASREYAARLSSWLAGHGRKETEVRGPKPPTVVVRAKERQLDVLRLLAAGQSNLEIARTHYIEVTAVKTHLKRPHAKLGVHGRVQAVRCARELSVLYPAFPHAARITHITRLGDDGSHSCLVR